MRGEPKPIAERGAIKSAEGKPSEPPKEMAPLGAEEAKIIDRIDKDGDPDKVVADIAREDTVQHRDGNSNAEIPRGEPTGLREGLRAAYDPEHYLTLFHVTSSSNAEGIMEDGLKAAKPRLTKTAMVLFDTSQSYDEQIGDIVGMFKNYHHGKNNLQADVPKSAIILMIPKQEGTSDDLFYDTASTYDDVFQELPNQDSPLKFVIPPTYVWGSANINQEAVVQNKNFDPTPVA